MPITCSPSDDLATILLTMDYTGEVGVQTSVFVERSVNGAPFESFINYGLLCQQGYFYDTTMPLDVPVTYRATTNDNLVSTCTSTIDSGGFVWLKDPGRPWANIRMDLCTTPTPPASPDCAPPEEAIALVQFGTEVRAADANLFPYLGAETPGDVYSRRKAPTTSITFASRTCEAVDAIYTLFTAGGPLLIQAPAVYCWPDRFVQPGDLQMEYISRDQRKPWRLWSAPLAVVSAPSIVNNQGVVGQTWCAVADTYPTYTALTASGLTWGDIEVVI